jgi:3-dehydro-4-phosphotetronate decarboxylase
VKIINKIYSTSIDFGSVKMKDELIIFGKALADRGLVWGHSGNISARVNADTFLVTAGGADLSFLMDDDVISCSIGSDGYEGLRTPSREAGLHRNIYCNCDDASVVIHSQPFYCTLVACSDVEIKTDLLPEAMAYLGQVARVPYYHAGSVELADAVAVKASDSSVLLLANHGVVCWGKTLGEALIATETLELLCRMIVISRAGDIEMNYLGNAVMSDFVNRLKD